MRSTGSTGPFPESPWALAFAGAWRFTLVSLGAFAVWAFGGRWFHERLGEVALFAATATAFVALAGLALEPLMPGPDRTRRLYRVFVPAFAAYAVVWSLCWFLLGSGAGEWLGSLLGATVFVAVAGRSLGGLRSFAAATAVFFLTHTIGYFAGGAATRFLMESARDGWLDGVPRPVVAVVARLAWGLFYGLGFGAGLGYTLGSGRRRS